MSIQDQINKSYNTDLFIKNNLVNKLPRYSTTYIDTNIKLLLRTDTMYFGILLENREQIIALVHQLNCYNKFLAYSALAFF